MVPPVRPLRVVSVPPALPAAGPGWSDLALLAFLLAVHAVPVVALAAGRPWGGALAGYGAAVTVLGARELAREVRERWRT